MKSTRSKNIKPSNPTHSPFFQKESNNNFFDNNSKPFFNPSLVQAKLNVDQPNDPYEKEADAMADKVVQRHSDKFFSGSEDNPSSFFNKPNLTVQRKCAECEKEEKLQKKEKEKPEEKIQKKPIFESNAEPKDDEKNIQRKCDECEKEERIQKKPLLIQKQDDAGSSFSEFFQQPSTDSASSATSETQPSSPAPEGQTSTNANVNQQGQFIVDDSATPSEGQMRRSDFLQRLNDGICETVDQALQGTPFSSDNCPYIRAAFARYKNSNPIQLEQAIEHYGLSINSVQSAEDIIQQMKMRVSTGVSQWIKTGDLSGLPEDALAQIPASIKAMAGMASTIGNISQAVTSGAENLVSGIGNAVAEAGGAVVSGLQSAASSVENILFKSNDGKAHATQSPASVMQSLGKGNSIEGSTRSKMENAFGTNFSDVEIHTDSNAANLSKNMNARAFTVGNHIAFGNGEHQPGTLVGDALMAHELAHTLQQSGINNSSNHSYDSLEKDADESAVAVMTKMMTGEEVGSLKKGKRFKTSLSLNRCSKSKQDPPKDAAVPAKIDEPNSYATFGDWLASFPKHTAAGDTDLTSIAPAGLQQLIRPTGHFICDCADVSLMLKHYYLKAHNQKYVFKAGTGKGTEYTIGDGVSDDDIRKIASDVGSVNFQDDRGGSKDSPFSMVSFYKEKQNRITNLKKLITKGLKSGDLFVWQRLTSIHDNNFQGHVQTVQNIDTAGKTITLMQGNMSGGVGTGNLEQRQETFQQLTNSADGDGEIVPHPVSDPEESFFGAGPWK
ncbi:MAG TPA: DUF4157 domain-containing protein [Puia sp.]|nr:DUF4157 domain-containing protein [Puia sp.]